MAHFGIVIRQQIAETIALNFQDGAIKKINAMNCPNCNNIVLEGLQCQCGNKEPLPPVMERKLLFKCPECGLNVGLGVNSGDEVTCLCGMGFRQIVCKHCGVGPRVVPRNLFKYQPVCRGCGAALWWWK